MKYGKRIASLFMTMLIVSMFAVVPATACVPGESNSIKEVNVVELTENDKDMLYKTALQNEAVQNLKDNLIVEGLEEMNFSAYSKVTIFEDNSVRKTNILVIEYGSTENVSTDIVYVCDLETGENVVLLTPAENVDMEELKVGGSYEIENNIDDVNVYELFDIAPSKLPSPLVKYDTAEDKMKSELQTVVEKANIKSDNQIVGMLEYNDQKIVLVDSEDMVEEIVADAQGNIIAKYKLEPKLVGSTEYISDNSSIPMKTKIDLYQLEMKIPNGKDGTVERLTTDIITAQNEAWKEISCAYCLLMSEDLKVVAKGRFFIDYGKNVESVTQLSYKETNCNYYNSLCEFDRTTSGGSPERQVDATARWAVNLAPVTANWEINSWVSVNKYGTMDSGASEDSWVTPGFGCFGP